MSDTRTAKIRQDKKLKMSLLAASLDINRCVNDSEVPSLSSSSRDGDIIATVSDQVMVESSDSLKREHEPDEALVPVPKVKFAKLYADRQLIPKLSPSLLAKFSHLPSTGGTKKRNSGEISSFTPFSTFPLANHEDSSSNAKRVALSASSLCASARAKVYRNSDGAIIGRPPDDFPG